MQFNVIATKSSYAHPLISTLLLPLMVAEPLFLNCRINSRLPLKPLLLWWF